MLAQTLEATPASNYRYEDYDHLGGARREVVERLGPSPRGLTLDMCTGTGNFALEMARGAEGIVLGVDVVPTYVLFANERAVTLGLAERCRFKCADYRLLAGTAFDTISIFLGLCEVLKNEGMHDFLDTLATLTRPRARVVIVDEFLDDCEDEHEALGFAVHQAIGYRYLAFAELRDVIVAHAAFTIDESYLIRTRRPLLNVAGSREYIRAECGFNYLDGSRQVDDEAVWARFEPRILALDGMSVNAVLRVVTLRRVPGAGDDR